MYTMCEAKKNDSSLAGAFIIQGNMHSKVFLKHINSEPGISEKYLQNVVLSSRKNI